MKRNVTIAVVVIILALLSVFGFKFYKEQSEKALAEQRDIADKAEKSRLQAEADKRDAAEAEAHRLAALKAQQEAEASALQLEKLRADQAAAEAARIAAEKIAAAAELETARLAKERESLDTEARRQAELRAKDEAAADAARREALVKLAQAEQEKRELADREAARLASLKAQQALEEQAAKRVILGKTVQPPDYHRREHYYMQIDMLNNASAVPTKTPVEPAAQP